ncbi:conserved hypothetical protein [Mycoplasmopsis pulmonis]|uniref:Phosphoesterase n=1 Tax=Mycoplasmopsis pulmonis (strain UAB CTIP) TaxID=272635 RepID=Q98QQ9_MYCPU|nr:metallophosphoesterase [Mycoplasmopsis pulmonis]MDZ7293262.1 metallophosphoesterase [Mycoplasmopsis pulmonis]CAC13475.1 conserved hypothetical protein [Mycoplasmopsis pulmonis]VEU68065.1 phosphoesterase [Mycoplasmopsis pulmonis]
MKTTILIISDIHGDLKTLEKILKSQSYDYAISAGDHLLSYDLMQKYFDFFVAGNNDFDQARTSLDFEIMGKKIHLEHGHLIGSYNQLINSKFMEKVLKNSSFDILIYGHSHMNLLTKYEDKIAINPGSISLPRFSSQKSFAILTIANNKMNVEFKNVETLDI